MLKNKFRLKIWSLENYLSLVNDELTIELHDLNFREANDIQIHGLHYNTFFGGSSSDWAPTKDETSYFRNFKMGKYSSLPIPSRLDVDECGNDLDNCHAVGCPKK